MTQENTGENGFNSTTVTNVYIQHNKYSLTRNLKHIDHTGWAALAVVFLLWFFFTETKTKFQCIIYAITYSAIEFTWYTITVQTSEGIKIAPLGMKGRNGFTTVEQCIANIFYLPIAMHGYMTLLSPQYLPFIPYPVLIALRIAGFPLNIWLLEVTQARFLKFLMGYNPAWDYSGNPGSLLDGEINLHHWKLWVFLGTFACSLPAESGLSFAWTSLFAVHLIKMYGRWKAGQLNFYVKTLEG